MKESIKIAITAVIGHYGIKEIEIAREVESTDVIVAIPEFRIAIKIPVDMNDKGEVVIDRLENFFQAILDRNEEYQKLREFRKSFKWLIKE